MLDFIAFALVLYLLYDIRTKITLKSSAKLLETSLVLDTSAVIDGRILNLLEVPYYFKEVIIPEAVCNELQKIADLKGPYDRKRAIIGLDNIRKLRSNEKISVEIVKNRKAESVPVDTLVLELAEKRRAVLCTTDVALQKLAEARGCSVLNINQIAAALRAQLYVGDKVHITITAKGESRGQGIGHTEDGIMVVVEQSSHLLGKTVDVVIQKTHQTPTGQLAFAKLAKQPS